MIYQDKNYSIINKELYEKILGDIKLKEENEIYLYHYIVIKYRDNNDIKTVEIDQIKDLSMIDNKDILYKYYIKKIHYYTESGNYLYEYGEPYYIYNIGYFYIGGFIETPKEELEKIRELFASYNNNYKNMEFPFNDEEFISLNKSVINF